MKPFKKLFFFFRNVAHRFFLNQGSTHTAAIAFYVLISVIPVVISIVLITSEIIGHSEETMKTIQEAVQYNFPTFKEQIMIQIQALENSSGLLAIISALVFTWSAASSLNAVSLALNSIMNVQEYHSFIRAQLKGFVMIFFILILFFASVLYSIGLNILNEYDSNFMMNETMSFIVQIVRRVHFIPPLLSLVMFYLVYKFIPAITVRKRSALAGALTTTVLWESSKKILLWYLIWKAKTYNLIYGSLTSVIFFAIWCYFFTLILLIGGCVTAEIEDIMHRKIGLRK